MGKPDVRMLQLHRIARLGRDIFVVSVVLRDAAMLDAKSGLVYSVAVLARGRRARYPLVLFAPTLHFFFSFCFQLFVIGAKP